MKKTPRFAGVIKLAGGGPVQEALPVQFHPNHAAHANPYTDLSNLYGQPTTGGSAPEVDMDKVNKAKGLMGEHNALVKEIRTLQQEINTKGADTAWLKSNEGIRKVQRLQTLVNEGAHNVERSKEIFNKGMDRVKANDSNSQFVTDVNTGSVFATDLKTGDIKRVNPYDLFEKDSEGKPKYRPIYNSEARTVAEAMQVDSFDLSRSLDFKNNLGLTFGTAKVMDEVNGYLAKAGSSETGGSNDVYTTLSAVKDSAGAMDAIAAASFNPDAIAKLNISRKDKDNINQLKSIVEGMMNDPSRLSAEAKKGLENNIVADMLRRGEKPENPEAFRKEVRSRMAATLMKMATDQRESVHTRSQGISVTEKTAPLYMQVGPTTIEAGDWKVKGFTLNPDTYSKTNGTIAFGMKSKLMSVVDPEGVTIGNDDNANPQFSAQEAFQVLKNFHANTGHAMRVPVDANGKVAMNALNGEATTIYPGGKTGSKKVEGRIAYEQTHNNYLEAIDKAHKAGKRDEVEKLGNEMNDALAKIVDVSTGGQRFALRTALAMTGTAEGESAFFGGGVGNKLKKAGGVENTSEVTKKNITGSAKSDAEFWDTTIYAVLTPNVTLDAVVTGAFDEKRSQKKGGKITLHSIGGKLMSFNDLKS